MTSFDEAKQATLALDEVLGLLDEEVLHERIDAPINKALASFEMPSLPDVPPTPRQFLKTSADFIDHVHKHGLAVSQVLSPAQARAEAVDLIEGMYRTPDASGYDNALLVIVSHGIEGVSSVLIDMAGSLKANLRKKHLDWIMASKIQPLSWPVQRELVRELMQRWRAMDPQNAPPYPVEQLVYLCTGLIDAFVKSHQEIEVRTRIH